MDIVHCYDAINTFNVWYPSYLKRCLNRDSQFIVTALVYIEKAKEISQDEFKEEINKGLKNHEITEPPKIKKITLEERIRKERPPPRIRGMESSQPQILLQGASRSSSLHEQKGTCAEIGRAIGF